MNDPNALLTFVFKVVQYGGAVMAGISAFFWIKANHDRDQDKRDTAQWGAIGGVAAFLIGAWLSGMSFPTL